MGVSDISGKVSGKSRSLRISGVCSSKSCCAEHLICDLLVWLKEGALQLQTCRLLLKCCTELRVLESLSVAHTGLLEFDSDLHGAFMAWPLKLSMSDVQQCTSNADD